MIDPGTIGERDCPSCKTVVAHTYERMDTGSSTGAGETSWRSCIVGWICGRCGILSDAVEHFEDYDPAAGEWRPRTRRSVRVPVVGQPLHVAVKANAGHSWAPAGVNLSESGILVEFPTSVPAPEFAAGTALTVALQFEEHLVIVDGAVRRRQGSQYGIEFRPSPVPDGVRARNQVAALVATVERRWLAVRVPEAQRSWRLLSDRRRTVKPGY
jgi:hypothetical protein